MVKNYQGVICMDRKTILNDDPKKLIRRYREILEQNNKESSESPTPANLGVGGSESAFWLEAPSQGLGG